MQKGVFEENIYHMLCKKTPPRGCRKGDRFGKISGTATTPGKFWTLPYQVLIQVWVSKKNRQTVSF